MPAFPIIAPIGAPLHVMAAACDRVRAARIGARVLPVLLLAALLLLAVAFGGVGVAWADEAAQALQAGAVAVEGGIAVEPGVGDGGAGGGEAGGAARAKARGSSFRKAPVLKSGLYSLYTKLAQTRLVVSVESGLGGKRDGVRIAKATGQLGQRFQIEHLGDGVYSIQAASGEYLAERGGSVVQEPRRQSGSLAKRQKWRISAQRGGIAFSNLATGKVMGVAGGKAKAGRKLNTASSPKGKARLFRLARETRLIDGGTFSFKSRAGSVMLDVAGCSWRAGTNAQVWNRNGALAQKFRVTPQGRYCRISMELAGTVLQAGVKPGQHGNAYMAKRAKRASQLWKARISDSGIEFVNRATGGVLGIAGGKAAAGKNVCVSRASGKPAQAWRLVPTRVQMTRLSTLRPLVENASSGGNRGVRVDGRQSGYKMSRACRDRIHAALGQAWSRGEDISFVLVDLKSGATVTVGPDRSNHGASTFKAAFVTYLFQNLRERGHAIDGNTRWLMEQTVVYSNNDAYQTLRSRFGTGGFRSWLDDVGLGYLAGEPFPRLTARKLALIWAKICSYEQSGGRYVGEWRSLFNHSYFSFIHEALSGSNTVYSKPGWYPKTAGYDALNDAAIVKDRRGGSYLVAVLSNTSCYAERWIMRDFARALDALHRDMARQGKARQPTGHVRLHATCL